MPHDTCTRSGGSGLDWNTSGKDASLPISVNVASVADLLADLERRLRQEQGFTVATLNLDHVVKLRHDPDFRTAYARHSHVTADGNPIVWLARLARQEVSLAPGSDLVWPVLALASRLEAPVVLLGATAETLAAAAEQIAARHPGIRIVAQLSPAMGFDPEGAEADRMISAIDRAGARLCLLALGAPRQERFAARASARLPTVGFLSIGASLDFIAGTQRRAPRLVRALAAEWLWRLAGNPSRLGGRYLSCLAILPGLTVMALRSRRGRRREGRS